MGRSRRRQRFFSELDKQALLKAIEECRRACISANAHAPIGGEIYAASNALCESIDNLAQVLTGDRTHFHLKLHSTP